MIFRDRRDAGKQLVAALQKYRNQPDTIVIGLPRGGVVTAFEVAHALELPLDVIFPRKVGAPSNPELAIGAVTETGEGVYNEGLIEQLGIPDRYIQQAVEQEVAVAQKRLETYRKVCPKLPLEGKTVLLVDDGLATGATMKASIQSVRSEGALHIVVAVPVSPPDTLEEVRDEVDEAVALSTPENFSAVGQFYNDFGATEDDEVVALLKKARASS